MTTDPEITALKAKLVDDFVPSGGCFVDGCKEPVVTRYAGRGACVGHENRLQKLAIEDQAQFGSRRSY